ncbi:MAG: hypothetical protein O2960_12885 [Verrucomicrobia bacterium]|nr:hypothetical protein [Verrucomicrobiota bacterium]
MIGIPYEFYLGIKNETFDFIEQNRVFNSLGEDLGQGNNVVGQASPPSLRTVLDNTQSRTG